MAGTGVAVTCGGAFTETPGEGALRQPPAGSSGCTAKPPSVTAAPVLACPAAEPRVENLGGNPIRARDGVSVPGRLRLPAPLIQQQVTPSRAASRPAPKRLTN